MKDKISVIIHFPAGKEPKIISFKIKYLKYFFIIFCIFLVGSLGSYLINFYFFQKYISLKEKEKRLKNFIILNKKYKEDLKKLKDNLMKLENYLIERGVIKNEKIGLGGISKISLKELSEEEYLKFLITKSEKLYYQLKTIPTGFPVEGEIVSVLGWRKNPFGSGYEYHTGIDINAPYGTPVYATAEGMVEYAGWYMNYGKTVIIRHPSGYKTLYAHLSQIKVKDGTKVKSGEVIGYIGSTGRSTGAHLHYEILLGSKYLDPLKFMIWE